MGIDLMKTGLLALAAVAGMTLAGGAHAATITATSAIGASVSPFMLGDFGNANTSGLVSTAPIMIANGVITFTNTTTTMQAGVYDGSVSNVATSAFNQTNLSPRNYLVAEPGNPVNIAFNSTQSQFQLLWGSVDSYNNLTLTLSGSAGTTTITGADIRARTNSGGPAFVTISDVSFNTATITSSTAAFEFDPSVQVPEPTSIALLGAGLAGLGFIRRRRNSAAS